MNTTLRDTFARQANHAGHPAFDIEELLALGEARLRRRRLTAVLGSAAAVFVAIGLVLGGAALIGPVKQSEGPVDDHTPSPVRKLLYSDVPLTSEGLGQGVIHFGDRAIETENGFVHLDVTDDGFVYTSEDGVWFSDGGSPEQISSLRNSGTFLRAQDTVMTGATGSLVAWFACTNPDSACANPDSATLVVYDTGSGSMVVRQPMPCTTNWRGCNLEAVVGEHIYFTMFNRRYHRRELFSYDVTTGRQNPATPRSYAADVRSNPRGMMIGTTWQTATPTATFYHPDFVARGTRLVTSDLDRRGRAIRTTAFDTATHQAIQLRLPPGYHAHGATFNVFEWLDDDTVALAPAHNLESADIITCRLSEGSCRLTVKAGPDDVVRIVPGRWLPG